MEDHLQSLIRILKNLNSLRYCLSHGERFRLNEVEEEVIRLIGSHLFRHNRNNLDLLRNDLDEILNNEHDEAEIARVLLDQHQKS